MSTTDPQDRLAVSRTIAGLAGPAIVALIPSELLNYHIWAGNPAASVYFNGTVLFVVGLAIVRAHNHWSLAWPVLVTLTGWVAIGLGLLRMFRPDAGPPGESPYFYAVMAVLFAAGLIMTIAAYRSPQSLTNK